MPTYEEDLIKRARELQRLATKHRRLKRQLKACLVEMKHARKLLKAVQAASEGRRPDVAPNRLDGGASGFVMPAADTMKHTADCASQGAIGGQGVEFIPCNCGAAASQDVVDFVEGLTPEEKK